AACLPLPTLGDDHLEISVHYSPYRVRQQLGFDQGAPSSPSHGDPSLLHRIFWTEDRVLGDGRPLALALADRQRVGGLSKAYQSYWNRCFASFSRFHAAHCDMLIPTVIYQARLVSEEKAISLSEKRNLPFISKSGRKREEISSVERKKRAVSEPKNFVPKVAASGPPSSKKGALPESSPRQQLAASGGSKHTVPETSSPS
ncbi:PREDICTED: LOC110773182, partial [Prunus dulcis]